MAGVELRIEADWRPVQARMKKLKRLTNDLEPFFADVGEYLLTTIEDRFVEEQAPDGTAWQDVTPETRRRKKHDKILTESTDLRGSSMSYDAHADDLEIGTSKIYGATQQLGREEANIVARPFLGLSDEDEVEVGELLEEHLEEALRP